MSELELHQHKEITSNRGEQDAPVVDLWALLGELDTLTTNPEIQQITQEVLDALADNGGNEERLRSAWGKYADTIEGIVDAVKEGPEGTLPEPQLRARFQIAAILHKAMIFLLTDNVARYLQELDTAEVYAYNESFEELSEALRTEIELGPTMIALKLKGVLSEESYQGLIDELNEDELDLDEVLDKAYTFLLIEGNDPEEVLRNIGIIE